MAETVGAVFGSLERMFDEADLLAGPRHASLSQSLIHEGVHPGQASHGLLVELHGTIPLGAFEAARQSCVFTMQDVLQFLELRRGEL